MADPRLALADSWAQHHRYLERQIDELTETSRYARQQERRLRDEVRREREAVMLQADADRDLERVMRWRSKG